MLVGLTMGSILIIIAIVALICVCVMWVNGIDHMNKNFPDYKAEDFFNGEEEEIND